MPTTNPFPALLTSLWQAWAGLLTPATYTQRAAGASDPPVEYPLAGVLVGTFSARDIDGERVRENDRRFLVRQSDLPITPRRRDTVRLDTVHWEIVGERAGLAGEVWVFHCRQV